MARTVNEIFNSIVAAKMAEPALSGLTSNSVTAVWRLWAYVTSVAHYTLESLWDLFMAEVEAKIAKAQPGTDEWYAKKALEFQFGDALQIVNNQLIYATIDPSKQVVKRVSVTDDKEGGSIIKVATLMNGNLASLSTPQLTAFRFYVDRLQFAGSKLSVISLNSDLLKFSLAIYYNALYDLEGTTGLKARIAKAVDEYLLNLDFRGNVILNDLEFYLRKVDGVKDAVVSSPFAKRNGADYQVVVRSYETVAGYIRIDPDFPLSSNAVVQYIPQ